MARSSYYTDPSRKHLEVYQDFSAGLNTVTAVHNLSDNEMTDLINIDLSERGTLKRRNGMVSHLVPATGKGQGYFRYYVNETTYHEIVAIGGKLYKDGSELPITGLASFQTTRNIEAVQFRNKLYIATGTELVEYDGTTASVVTPYAPQPLEALYIGTNGLSDDPDNFMQDGEAANLRIDGITFSSRYTVINEPVTLTAYVSKPSGSTIEYQFEYRFSTDLEGTWTIGQAYSTTKTYQFTTEKDGDMQFRVFARVQGSSDDPAQYIVPKYRIKPSPDPNDVEPDTSTIGDCNRIILHWNRLIMYGDQTNPDLIYISHLNNPAYFPVTSTLRFENERQEKLTRLVQYRDMLVAFTPTSIQALYGKAPLGEDSFRRLTLHKGLGCIAPDSIALMQNYITFLSREGIQVLKSIGYTESKVNVEKIDTSIDNIVPRSEDACAVIFDNQYHITFPQEKKRFRYYYDYGVWTKDESDKLDLANMWEWDGTLYVQSDSTGEVFKFDENAWDDAGYVYEDRIATKYYDFGQPNNPKKLKELQLLVGHFNSSVELEVTVYADSATALNPDTSSASVDSNGNVVWTTSSEPNLKLDAGTVFGSWEVGVSKFGSIDSALHKLRVSGKCRRSKVVISHTQATPNHLLGLGYIFKVKKA